MTLAFAAAGFDSSAPDVQGHTAGQWLLERARGLGSVQASEEKALERWILEGVDPRMVLGAALGERAALRWLEGVKDALAFAMALEEVGGEIPKGGPRFGLADAAFVLMALSDPAGPQAWELAKRHPAEVAMEDRAEMAPLGLKICWRCAGPAARSAVQALGIALASSAPKQSSQPFRL